MLLDPPKILPPGWAKKMEKVGPITKRGRGGFPCPNFFLKAKGEKTEKKRKKLGQFPSEGGGFPCPNLKKTKKW